MAAGSNCTINGWFSPTAAGQRTAAISFADNSTGSPQSVTLTGTGTTGGPAANISPLSLTFSSQNVMTTSPAQGLTLQNTGCSTMRIVSIIASGDYRQTNSCGTSLAASASCRVQVISSPCATGTGAAPSSAVSILPVEAPVNAEPLYVQGLNVAGLGVHNVVYVATENDSVYAFDADGTSSPPLWQESLLPAGGQVLNAPDIGGCSNISPLTGITSPPLIDSATNTMFVVARDFARVSQGINEWAALDAADGEKFHGCSPRL